MGAERRPTGHRRGTGQLVGGLPDVIATAHALSLRRVRAASLPPPLQRAEVTPPARVRKSIIWLPMSLGYRIRGDKSGMMGSSKPTQTTNLLQCTGPMISAWGVTLYTGNPIEVANECL